MANERSAYINAAICYQYPFLFCFCVCNDWSLGAGHDGIDNSCSFDDQFIMAAYSEPLTDTNYRNAFTFSPCTVSEFRNFLNSLDNSLR